MVSAKLLAEVDTRLRSLAGDIDPYVLNTTKTKRPFAGLDLLVSGDFWQLPPPDGGFLGDVPCEYIAASRKFTPAPTIAHGQSLLWSGPINGIQGVTELAVCERTPDTWLQSIQNEFREGRLTDETHAFLHGNPTMQPACTKEGKNKCTSKTCTARCKEATTYSAYNPAFARETMQIECDACKRERKSRKLVADDAQDSRFKEKRFLTSPAVFPNNDSKYDVNKKRSLNFAASEKTGIMYSIAEDIFSARALQERADLPARKLEFLSRHDRESGDLYGILPLIKGMPVAITDHIDRSDKRILRGRVGHVHSWVLEDDEPSVFQNGKRILRKLPKVVFVKFKDKKGKEVYKILGSFAKQF